MDLSEFKKKSKEIYLNKMSKYILDKRFINTIEICVYNDYSPLHDLLMNKYEVTELDLMNLYNHNTYFASKNEMFDIILDYGYLLCQEEYDYMCKYISYEHALKNNLQITAMHIKRRCIILFSSPRYLSENKERQEYNNSIINTMREKDPILQKQLEDLHLLEDLSVVPVPYL